ncbi:MAG: type I DNA topoisomerase [Armatimonadetes bacterium]|nr:type I DNA topoisomerase [Armatimonadota bacterium]
MAKDLIIVESVTKTRTLSQFLGEQFEVRASLGHVRDLPKSRLGVDVEQGFRPTYTLIPERKKVLADLRRAVQNSRCVYLATDPDREGEAIAWHLQEALQLENPRRIEFNEITQRAVREALKHSRSVDPARVNAQQARRVLDRLVGYKLSPLLWKKIQKNLSAGRVQSVAVRLIVDREREIARFQPEEYWRITARLTPAGQDFSFEARLVQVDGGKAELPNRDAAVAILERLGHILEDASGGFRALARPEAASLEWRVGEIKRTRQRRNPAPPFITSTLQQEASRKLGFSTRGTMVVAQQLYEGVELGEQGHVGLITYMRTDSVHIAAEAREEARAFVTRRFGPEYVPEKPWQYRSRAGAQEAHEAIRPASVERVPDDIRQHLSPDQYRLYRLIWQRFVASQMASAVFDVTTVDVPVAGCLFRATERIPVFDGFMRVYTESRDEISDEDEDRRLPALASGQRLDLLALLPSQHWTEPPPRYTVATLVKALEERQIGRPSTYAQILSTIVERGYVVLEEKRFWPTDLGCVVTDQLVRHFPRILSVDFTAEIEQQLDDIAAGDREWIAVLDEFYGPFAAALERAEVEMERVRPEPKPTGEICPECGQELLIRASRRGEFIGCSGFPKCRYTRNLEPAANGNSPNGESAAEEAPACPQCGRPMVKRRGRFGEFFGCSGYPECRTVFDPKKPASDFSASCPRPDCGGTVSEKRSRKGQIFYGCSNYPQCDFATWDRPTDQRCETCGYPLGERSFRGRALGLRCTNGACPTATASGNGKQAAGGPEAVGMDGAGAPDARTGRRAARSRSRS